jgi:serralysin
MITLHIDGSSYNEWFGIEGHRLVIHAGGGTDLVFGGPWNDILFGDGDRDFLYGHDGADEIHGGAGSDVILGEAGRDKLFGDGGGDFINGGEAPDRIDGGGGSDRLWGGSGADHIAGGAGNDRIDGGSPTAYPADSLLANGILLNRDGISGLPLNQAAIPDPGLLAYLDTARDVLDGGAGNDLIDGGLGNDALTGGAGHDRFFFLAAPSLFNIDTISDFTHGIDKIALSHLVYAAIGGSLSSGEFRLGTVAKDANDHILYNPADGYVAYDADGKGGAGAEVFTILANHAQITSVDFLVG